jgi:arylsulfatase A-like enzyme
MRKPFLIALALAVIAIVSGLLWWQSQPCRSGCNVILIMVDTLSAKHLATYGYERDTMPKTTAFFEKSGAIFENASSNAPWTFPSFTSMYFSDLATHITFAELEDESRPTLQSELRKNDVRIKAVELPIVHFIFDTITRLYKADELIPNGTTMAEVNASPFLRAKQELTELSSMKDPFFLMIHTFQAHDPFDPVSPYNETFGSSNLYPSVTREDLWTEPRGVEMSAERAEIFRLRYDQQLLEFDEELSAFLDSARELSPKDTVIILASDHGEAFGEHQFVSHAITLYDEELHIPIMVSVPGIRPARITDPVSLLDMAPTVLSFMNIDAPSSFKGQSLVPVIKGDTLSERVIPFVNGSPYFLDLTQKKLPFFRSLAEAGALGIKQRVIGPNYIGFRLGSQKLFVKHEPPATAETFWFDLSTDPAEKNNLATGDYILPEPLKRELEKLTAEFPKE